MITLTWSIINCPFSFSNYSVAAAADALSLNLQSHKRTLIHFCSACHRVGHSGCDWELCYRWWWWWWWWGWTSCWKVQYWSLLSFSLFPPSHTITKGNWIIIIIKRVYHLSVTHPNNNSLCCQSCCCWAGQSCCWKKDERRKESSSSSSNSLPTLVNMNWELLLLLLLMVLMPLNNVPCYQHQLISI